MAEETNPLEKGKVGSNGDTNVTNYAWIDVDIDGVKITNIPLRGGEDIENEHPLHSSGFNCFIKSFTCNRAVPKGVEGFWNNAGGGMECSLSVFDPTFIQFEQLVMEKVKQQKVYCRVSYGISQRGTNLSPAPFELHCLITKMDESVTATGAEWNLTLNTTPPEFFDVYPEKGKDNKKETVYKIGKDTEYKRISDIVKKLLEEENWKGVVIETKELSKKEMKIPTKDFSSRIDLIRLKLAPMAQCSDDNHQDAYQLLTGLDGAVYFMPFGMTIKDALESNIAIKVNDFDINEAKEGEEQKSKAVKESIEQLNMRDYISEDNGRLTFKYGFQNSVVQSFNINYDCMSMVTQFWYQFVYRDNDGKEHSFDMPNLSDKQKKELGKTVKNNKVFLWDTNEEDAKETAKSIVRKLHIVDYNGSATLINWPYIMPMQQVSFQYMIPSGSKMALNDENTNKPVEPSTYEAESISEKANENNPKSKRSGGEQNNNVSNGNVDSEKTNATLKEIYDNREERMKSNRTKLKNNSQNKQTQGNEQFKQNVGVPTSLGSWSDTHKSSITYLVASIKDTIEGGIMISELELKALFADSFPQLNESMKS